MAANSGANFLRSATTSFLSATFTHRDAVPGQAPTVAWSGFTTVIDIAFGPDGSLYVLEHSTGSTGPPFFQLPGRLLKVAPDGTRTSVIAGLTRPGSVAIGPDGVLYVSNRSTSVGTGEVLRIEP